MIITQNNREGAYFIPGIFKEERSYYVGVIIYDRHMGRKYGH